MTLTAAVFEASVYYGLHYWLDGQKTCNVSPFFFYAPSLYWPTMWPQFYDRGFIPSLHVLLSPHGSKLLLPLDSYSAWAMENKGGQPDSIGHWRNDIQNVIQHHLLSYGEFSSREDETTVHTIYGITPPVTIWNTSWLSVLMNHCFDDSVLLVI